MRKCSHRYSALAAMVTIVHTDTLCSGPFRLIPCRNFLRPILPATNQNGRGNELLGDNGRGPASQPCNMARACRCHLRISIRQPGCCDPVRVLLPPPALHRRRLGITASLIVCIMHVGLIIFLSLQTRKSRRHVEDSVYSVPADFVIPNTWETGEASSWL